MQFSGLHAKAKELRVESWFGGNGDPDGNVALADFRMNVDLIEFHGIAKQIAEIAANVINMNLWTRLKPAQGQVPVMEP